MCEKYSILCQFYLYSIQWRAGPGFKKNSKGEITDRLIYVKPKNVDRRKLIGAANAENAENAQKKRAKTLEKR